MTLGAVFETGSMAGLMSYFSRHSGFLTNFSILYAESRPYWLQVGTSAREEPRCAEGPGRAWSAWVDACSPVTGIGWALAIPW